MRKEITLIMKEILAYGIRRNETKQLVINETKRNKYCNLWTHRCTKLTLRVCYVNEPSHKRVGFALQTTVETLNEKYSTEISEP